MPTLLAEFNVRQVEQGVDRIINALDRLENEAAQTGRILDGAFSDNDGLDDFDDGLRRSSNSSGVLTGSLRGLAPVVAGVFSLQTARAAFDLAESFDSIENRVRAVTPDLENLDTVVGNLADISRQTGVGFEDVAATFQRFSIATNELGISQDRVLEVVSILNQGLVAYGATAEEAASVSLQLGQGFASGALQGDEPRSVLEGFPALANAIADELGIAVGDVKEFGSEGRITADVLLRSFDRLGTSVDELGESIEITSNRSFNALRTSVIEIIGNFDKRHRRHRRSFRRVPECRY